MGLKQGFIIGFLFMLALIGMAIHSAYTGRPEWWESDAKPAHQEGEFNRMNNGL